MLHYSAPIISWILVAINYHFVVKMFDNQYKGDIVVLVLSFFAGALMLIFVIYQSIFHNWIRKE